MRLNRVGCCLAIILLSCIFNMFGQDNSNPASMNGIQLAGRFSGADACIKIQNAIAALPENGGEIDARALSGFQDCSANPFANIQNAPGESVHLYLAAGSTYMTSAQWRIPQASIVTGGGRSAFGGGRGTSILAKARRFPALTPVVFLGDTPSSQGALVENLTIDCNHISGCTGVFSDRVEEQGGVRNVSVYNFKAFGIEMLDRSTLPPGNGGQPENYVLDELELAGDAGSTCIQVRVGSGGQRGGAHVTCTSALVELGHLTCSEGVVSAAVSSNSIPSGASIGVESGTNSSFTGLFKVTSSSSGQLQWVQRGCRGTSNSALIGTMIQNGILLQGSDGNYSQIHCEFTVDCVDLYSGTLEDRWTIRAVSIAGVTGQASVRNIVHMSGAKKPEDILLSGLQRCIGPDPGTQGCAVNVLVDYLNTITLQDPSLGWYFLGHSSVAGAVPAVLSSSPSVSLSLANPFLIFRNAAMFSQLGAQSNGAETYCSNCTVAQPSACSVANLASCVCAAGGTGAFAKRVDGRWLCN